MKKLFITLVTCIIIVGWIMFATRSSFLYNKLEEMFEAKELKIDNIKDNNTIYWYNTLSDKEQEIYRKIANGVSNLEKRITIDILKQASIELFKNVRAAYKRGGFENKEQCDLILSGSVLVHSDIVRYFMQKTVKEYYPNVQ